MSRPDLITQTTGAERALVTTRTIRNWISQGKLTAYRQPGGRAVRIDARELDQLLTGNPVPTVAGEER